MKDTFFPYLLFSPCSFSPSVSRELVVSGQLVCSRLSLSELSAVSMPNPDVTGNWAPQIRKAALVSQTAGASRVSSISSGAKREREKKQEKERTEI